MAKGRNNTVDKSVVPMVDSTKASKFVVKEENITGEMQEQFYLKCESLRYKEGSLYDLLFVFDMDILSALIGVDAKTLTVGTETSSLFAKKSMISMKIMRLNGQATRELACIITKQDPSEIKLNDAVEVVLTAVPFLY